MSRALEDGGTGNKVVGETILEVEEEEALSEKCEGMLAFSDGRR